ncbi:MAG TPA: hypothetical protein VF595_05945 [Tepidisphaeraceae bacterium]|jgi:hypothetical protein
MENTQQYLELQREEREDDLGTLDAEAVRTMRYGTAAEQQRLLARQPLPRAIPEEGKTFVKSSS